MTDFQQIIICWYNENKRELPWRDTKNPYNIWLSEIILQQTRVAQGLAYYEKFLRHYPTVAHLAAALEQEVLTDWQGLGYYSRARNLHATAKKITSEFNAVFPSDYHTILKLKGIGEYTAAAIASFAFDLPHAVVDGNVFRVLSRLHNIDIPIDSTEGKKYYSVLANELLDRANPGIYNQAMMEFGAMQCIPGKPNCGICPLVECCMSFKQQNITNRPVKKGKTKVRNRYFLYLIFWNPTKKTFFLRKRTEKDIWQELYEFPLIEFESDEATMIFLNSQTNHLELVSATQKHILSHQHIYSRFTFVTNTDLLKEFEGLIELSFEELGSYPLPRLIDRFIENNYSLFNS
jgi:A/G-specific adenine glycosylase